MSEQVTGWRNQEPPCLDSIKWTDKDGNEHMVVVRADTLDELFGQVKTIQLIIASLKKSVREHEPIPEPRGDLLDDDDIPFDIDADMTFDIDSLEPPPAHPEPPSGLSFISDQLSGSVNNGRTYWKIKGGKFTRYGVPIWPEVLIAAIGQSKFEALDPRHEYDLQNYRCEYTMRPDGKNPDKITKMTKV